jgi:hypothetical protein
MIVGDILLRLTTAVKLKSLQIRRLDARILDHFERAQALNLPANIAVTPEAASRLTDCLRDGQIAQDLLTQLGLRAVNIEIDGAPFTLYVAHTEAGQKTNLYYCDAEGDIYQAEVSLPPSTVVPAAPAVLPPSRVAAVAVPRAEFLEKPGEALRTIAQYLARGSMVFFCGMVLPRGWETTLSAELEKLGLDETQRRTLVESFTSEMLFTATKGVCATQAILDSRDRLEGIERAVRSGREVVVLAAQYDFVGQWLLTNPTEAINLSSSKRRILIEAGEYAQFEKGTHRSDGGKLVLVLEELIGQERCRHSGATDRANMAAAYPALRERIIGGLGTILEELDRTASLPNGFGEIYQTAQAKLYEQIDFLLDEAREPSGLEYLVIRQNVVVVKMPWREGAGYGRPAVSRRAIYAFMEAYNRTHSQGEQLHIAISYDPENRMGYKYIIGVNPNSGLSAELDLSNLWGTLAEREVTERTRLGLPLPPRNWGGGPAAGGSPMSSRHTVLDLATILEAIGRLPTVERVSSGVAMYRKHTLNLPDYLTPRIPRAALIALDEGRRVTIELHHGPYAGAQERYLSDLRSQLESLEAERYDDGVKQVWYRVRGSDHYVVCNILGETKLEHMRLYLTYAGITVDRIYHHVQPSDYLAAAEALLETARAQNGGQLPRTVVIGPGGTFSGVVATRLSAQTALRELQRAGRTGAALLESLMMTYSRAIGERIRNLSDNLSFEIFSRNNPRVPERTPDGKQPRLNAYRREVIQSLKILAYFGVRIFTERPTLRENAFASLMVSGKKGEEAATLEDIARIRESLIRGGFINEQGEIQPQIYFPGYLDIAPKFRGRVLEILRNADNAFYDGALPGEVTEITELIPGIRAGLETISGHLAERPFADRATLTAALAQRPEELIYNHQQVAAIEGLRGNVEEVFAVLGVGGKKPPITFGTPIRPESIKGKVESAIYAPTSLVSIPGLEPFLMVTIPFGRLTEYVGAAIAKQPEIEQVMFFGNGGFITGEDARGEAVEVGDLFVPAEVLQAEGSVPGFQNRAIPFVQAAGLRTFNLVGGETDVEADSPISVVISRHAGFVVSPMQEHDRYVAHLQARQAGSVELEIGPLMTGLAGFTGSTTIMGYYSDVPGREGATLADARLGQDSRIAQAKQQMINCLLESLRRETA